MVLFEAELQKEYRSILRQEELLWFQKARENRVRLGDRNTAYFHTQTLIRRRKNRVHRLKLEDGTWCEDDGALRQEVHGFFTKLFSEVSSVAVPSLTHDAFPTLSAEAKTVLVEPVEKGEVTKALMSMKSYTAPGSDGFQPYFYKKFWNRVGDSLWHMVRDAFQGGGLARACLTSWWSSFLRLSHPPQLRISAPSAYVTWLLR